MLLFEEWRTPSDLWTWTGGRLNRPRLLPGTEALIESLRIEHYEALDVDLEELGLFESSGGMLSEPPDDVAPAGTD